MSDVKKDNEKPATTKSKQKLVKVTAKTSMPIKDMKNKKARLVKPGDVFYLQESAVENYRRQGFIE